MGISADGEGKAAAKKRILGGRIWILERAAGEDRFLRLIEGNGPKLLPIAHKRVLDHDLMESYATLVSSQNTHS